MYAEANKIQCLHKARARGRQLECSLCKGPGASVDCTVSKCEEVFHFEVRKDKKGATHLSIRFFREFCDKACVRTRLEGCCAM